MEEESSHSRNYISHLLSSIGRLWNAQETLNVRNVRLSHLPYFLAFPLAMIFVNTQEHLFAEQAGLFSLSGGSVAFIGYCLGAALLFVFAHTGNMSKLSKGFSVLALIGFVLWLIMPGGMLGLLFAFLFMFGVGGCMSSGTFSFCFILNNAERFWGSAAVLLFQGLAFANSGGTFVPSALMKVFLIIIIAGIVICAFACRTESFTEAGKRPKGQFGPAVWLMYFLFMAYFYIEFIISPVPIFQGAGALLWRGMFSVTAVFLCAIIQVLLRRSLWTLWNLSFIAAIGCVAIALASQPEAANALRGLKSVGYFASFYLIGCVSNRFCDFRMFKRLIFLVMMSCIPIYIVPELLSGTAYMIPAAIGLSSALFVVFLMLSPAFAKHLFFAEWSENLRMLTMSEAQAHVEKADSFEKLNLTQREKEIAALLLQGMAVKELAAELDISFDTARFHNKNLYKKLGIVSRSELFARFGAEAKNAVEQTPRPQ